MRGKWDMRFWWSMGGILIFGVLLISAFEGIGYAYHAPTGDATPKLHDISNWGGKWKDVYGLSIASITIAWVTLLFPFATLFTRNNKTDQALNITALLMVVVALVLGVAAEGVFTQIGSVKEVGVVKGKEAGVFVLVIFGGLLAFALCVYACVPPKKERQKPNHKNNGKSRRHKKGSDLEIEEAVVADSF